MDINVTKKGVTLKLTHPEANAFFCFCMGAKMHKRLMATFQALREAFVTAMKEVVAAKKD